jgi:hypothetical protein
MEQETVKLLNVLRRIARAAGYAAWVKSEPEATQFCVGQYNRVLARLTDLEPAIKSLFTPLSDSASPQVTRIAARELLAYFEVDEPEFVWGFERARMHGWPRRRGRVRCAPMSLTCD